MVCRCPALSAPAPKTKQLTDVCNGWKADSPPFRHSRESGNPAKQKGMRESFSPTAYLLASRRNGTLYTGVTSNLMARVHQHRQGFVRGFTRRYGIKLLVWFEQHAAMESAITREKQIKKWNRAR